MQIGVDSFVAATVDAAGRAVDPARHLSELLEAITLADEVGLDVFGIGEHHRREFLDSAPIGAESRNSRRWCSPMPNTSRPTSSASVIASSNSLRCRAGSTARPAASTVAATKLSTPICIAVKVP